MKTSLKLIVTGFLLAGFFSCSRTRDAVGLDTIQNTVRSGYWKRVDIAIKGVDERTSLIPEGGKAKFMATKIQFFDQDDNSVGVPLTYEFKDTKTIVIDGTEYAIQENFVSTIKEITAVSKNDDGLTTYYFDGHTVN